MKKLQLLTNGLSAVMEFVAGIALIAITLLIGTDILGRIVGHPVPGAYEIVSLAGGLIIGLALPATSIAKAHVSTDLLLTRLPASLRPLLGVITRLIGVATFGLATWGTIMMGLRLKGSGEVTPVLSLPLYYATCAMGCAFLIQAMVLISEIAELLNSQQQRSL